MADLDVEVPTTGNHGHGVADTEIEQPRADLVDHSASGQLFLERVAPGLVGGQRR